jgi:hypothetical protein
VREGYCGGFFPSEANYLIMVCVLECRLKQNECRRAHSMVHGPEVNAFSGIWSDIGESNALVTGFAFWIDVLLSNARLGFVLVSFCQADGLETGQGSGKRIGTMFDGATTVVAEGEPGNFGRMVFSTNPRIFGAADRRVRAS